ncbi:hypothetical protein DSO57_1015066 [Entomophthora muscae]|uniref:Uncharacterized protein n=1 Tax=Entomophthora muscae TaxID=34485 RepID=A0ACC2SIB4_9FUNG|nr:hypothetical protein DSO57_1015066 [Entomophthora muscae]
MSTRKYVIGVDMGTSSTYVSVVRDGEVVSIPTINGNIGFPTLVVFTQEECLVGEAAAAYPGEAEHVFNFKKLIEKDYNPSHARFRYPFNLSKRGEIKANCMGLLRRFRGFEMMALILGQAKRDAEAFLGERVKGAVIAVPCFFNSEQRKLVLEAAFLANLSVERLVNDTSSVALSNGLQTDGTSLVVDFSAGAFQVAAIAKVGNTFRVLAEEGSCELGGQSMDEKMTNHFSSQLLEYGIDVTLAKQDLWEVKRGCEDLKCALSYAEEAETEVHFSERTGVLCLKKESFERLCHNHLLECLSLCSNVSKLSKYRFFRQVLLAGRSSRIPKFHESIHRMFSTVPVTPHPTSVANGAALLGSSHPNLNEILHSELCVACDKGFLKSLIPKGTPIPLVKYKPIQVSGNSFDFMSVVSQACHLADFKVMRVGSGPEDFIECKFCINTNGILTIEQWLESSFIMAPLPTLPHRESEILDIGDTHLNLTRALPTSRPTSALQEHGEFIQTLGQRIQTISDHFFFSALMTLYSHAIEWIEMNSTQSDYLIRKHLVCLTRLEALANEIFHPAPLE